MASPALIVSTGSHESDNPGDIVYSNVSFVNVIHEEGGSDSDLHPDSLLSFAVDFYAAQMSNGGFAQFVYNSRLDPTFVGRIEQGLEKLGGPAHVDLYRELLAQVGALAPGELEAFYAGEYFGENPVRDRLGERNSEFYALERLTDLNAAWLRSHPDLRPVSIDEMFAAAEAIVGHPIQQNY